MPSVKLFAFVGDVAPGGGGTIVLHVFHARSPDTGTAPRLMLGKEIRAARR